jgi:predicted DNA-binding transcriptional regulator AlpA
MVKMREIALPNDWAGEDVTMPCWVWGSQAGLLLIFAAKQSQLKKRFYRHCQMLKQHSDSVGVTRQNLRKLMLQHHASFPLPIHEGKAVMWHLSDMLQWLQQKMAYKVSESDLQLAEVTKQVNLAKALSAVNKPLMKEMKPLIY